MDDRIQTDETRARRQRDARSVALDRDPIVAPMVMTILVFALLHAAIMGLLRLLVPREIPQG